MSFARAAEIEQTLEIAANWSGDLNGAVYARLFAAYPETEPLFALDRDGQVRGAMMAHVFQTILDFIGARHYAHRFIQTEIVTHEGYNVPRDAFAAFFAMVRDELRTVCADGWTPAMESAWEQLLNEIGAYVAAVPKVG